jgi:peptidoglycan/LPS O-acetylase OafA/YrhL
MTFHFARFLPAVGSMIVVKGIASYGWIGVDLFFVLSGFLITGILIRTKAATNYFSAFYVRRVLRIFPIYYGTLVAVFLAARIFHLGTSRVPPVEQRWLYFVYLTNWIPVWTHSWPPNVVGHFWSLGVEEQFYLLWPYCVLVCTRGRLLQIAVALSMAALVVRAAWVVAFGPSPGIAYATVTRMDSLLIGAICAIVYLNRSSTHPPWSIRWALLPLGLFFAGAALLRGSLDFIETVGYSLLAVGFGIVVLGAAAGDGTKSRLQTILGSPWLTVVGRYSYGMYVYHVPVLGICELVLRSRIPQALSRQPLFAVGYVLFLGLATFAVSAVSFEFVERPILNLKHRFEPYSAARSHDGATS